MKPEQFQAITREMAVAMPGAPKPPQNYGVVLLENNTQMTGLWTTNITVRTVHLVDDAGKEWWIDLDCVVAFSPQPKP